MNIGENIKKLRKLKSISQQDLAEVFEVNQSTIANYEKNIRQPNAEMLIKMAGYFHVSVDYILGIEIHHQKISFNNNQIQLADYFLELLMYRDHVEVLEFLNQYMTHYKFKTVMFKLFRYALTKLGWLWEVGAISISKEHMVSQSILDLIPFVKSYYELVNVASAKPNLMGMASPGEKHTIGLKMLMTYFELQGHHSIYIGESVPYEDLRTFINTEKPSRLIITITSPFFHSELENLLNKLEDVSVCVVGYGVKGYKNSHNNVSFYSDYMACLEAINETNQ